MTVFFNLAVRILRADIHSQLNKSIQKDASFFAVSRNNAVAEAKRSELETLSTTLKEMGDCFQAEVVILKMTSDPVHINFSQILKAMENKAGYILFKNNFYYFDPTAKTLSSLAIPIENTAKLSKLDSITDTLEQDKPVILTEKQQLQFSDVTGHHTYDDKAACAKIQKALDLCRTRTKEIAIAQANEESVIRIGKKLNMEEEKKVDEGSTGDMLVNSGKKLSSLLRCLRSESLMNKPYNKCPPENCEPLDIFNFHLAHYFWINKCEEKRSSEDRHKGNIVTKTLSQITYSPELAAQKKAACKQALVDCSSEIANLPKESRVNMVKCYVATLLNKNKALCDSAKPAIPPVKFSLTALVGVTTPPLQPDEGFLKTCLLECQKDLAALKEMKVTLHEKITDIQAEAINESSSLEESSSP